MGALFLTESVGLCTLWAGEDVADAYVEAEIDRMAVIDDRN